MRLIFNDGQELIVQSVELQSDGSLLVKTISATEDVLRQMFADKFATKKLTVVERESTLAVYENYTNFDAIVKYTAGILGVVIFKEGESPDDRLTVLEKENAALKENNEMLTQCVLELSELVYQ